MSTSNKNKTRLRAIIYTRVSTDEQARTGYSLRDQEQRLRRYCQLQGIKVVAHFQDDASAKTFDRPAFQDMLRFIKAHKDEVDQVLFLKWDRFSRNAEASYAMIRMLLDQGVEPQAVEQQCDLSVPENKLMLAFYLAAPQVENERRALNTKAGMRRAMREGRWVHRPPKGYTMQRDALNKPTLVPNADAVYIKRAFSEMAKGAYTMEEARLELRKQGFKCSRNQFTLILRNPAYIGKILIKAWRDEPEEIVDGLHEPLVTESLFRRVQSVLDQGDRRRAGKPSTRRLELQLRGHLVCAQCGGNLTGSGSKGNGGEYFYYHCQKGCKERFRASEAHDVLHSYLRKVAPSKAIAALYMAVMEDIFKENEGDCEKELAKLDAELDRFNERLLSVDEKYIEGEIAKDSYERLKDNYLKKRDKVERRKHELEGMDTAFMQYVQFGFSLAANLGKCYQDAPLAIKQKILGLIFPEKLVFDNGVYRTTGLNEVIRVIQGKNADLAPKKEGRIGDDTNPSYKVALPGFEPGTS